MTRSPSDARHARRQDRLGDWLEGTWLVGNVVGFLLLGYTVTEYMEAAQPPLAVEQLDTPPDAAES